MSDGHGWRSTVANRIIGEHHATGRVFDGIYQNLLPCLREIRRADPEETQIDGLIRRVQGVTGHRFRVSAVPFPHVILDAEVLVSYARLDSQTVGTALVDAVDDAGCHIAVSSPAYLIAHTALLALSYRCVVATLDPGAYHRLGYLRTVDLT
ncbi:hypothetical protein AB0G04_25355 [Actinoplanes sp. NPDC023801]|uniref:hypothetical protein n=1 Tax=Actinoplanes sp. NPDC023801 TaxID=3154595 RepID=UPI0033D1E857